MWMLRHPIVPHRSLLLLRRYCSIRGLHNDTPTKELIRKHTEISRDHLTPEIPLHLITPNCTLWNSSGTESPFVDPYWAFYWPGGQVLSRYILENKKLFRSKRVIDTGSGCGASAISCKLAGASNVIANDVDEVSLLAIQMNAGLSDVTLELSQNNIIGCLNIDLDILLLGDMFYDDNFVSDISEWVSRLSERGVTIYIGDPGRLPLLQHPLRHRLEKVAETALPSNCLKENNGMTVGYVWKFRQHC